jgi:arylsulfatase A-like enzyme
MTTKKYPIAMINVNIAAVSLTICGLFLLIDTSGATTGPAAKELPNIIVIFTDDQGYADLGVHGIVDDVKTPNLDQLARSGVLFTSGYVTAPQCTPSRAALLTGRYQQRFGINEISDNPMPLEEVTIAEYLKEKGYISGMVGKWHLDLSMSEAARIGDDLIIESDQAPLGKKLSQEAFEMFSPATQGFDAFYKNVPWWQSDKRWANFSASGRPLSPGGEWIAESTGDRLDDETVGALAFIEQNHQRPFFLYLAYSGPHTPLAATEDKLALFPGEMAERRRVGLAMIATMDDGVGKIVELLQKYDIEDNTLIFFASDNGAPTKMTKTDAPMKAGPDSPIRMQYNVGGWDGSINDPLLGEKGMLTEGGIRVPFFITWKGKMGSGRVCDDPVSTLDIAPTILAATGINVPENLDGRNLLPFLMEEDEAPPEEPIYWRFWKQSAVRLGDWKLLHLGDGTNYLYNLKDDMTESENLAAVYPEKVSSLHSILNTWAQELKPPGLPRNGIQRERGFYRFYLNHE